MFGVRGSLGNLSNKSIGIRLLQNVSLRGLRVQGIRIGNADIPENKPLKYALQNIHGIGPSRAQQLLADLNMTNKRARELTAREVFCLREELSKYMTEHDLRRCVKNDIERLINIQSYRGIRHSDGLPCRGQRTRDNARTAKGRGIRV